MAMADDEYRNHEFTSRPRDELPVPVGFRDWPRRNQIEYLRLSVSRPDLLAVIRGYIGSDRSGDRVDKQELAQLALELNLIS